MPIAVRNIPARLVVVTDRMIASKRAPRPLGYFGASTGAAAALIVAAQRPAQIAAVVSRGGRPEPSTRSTS